MPTFWQVARGQECVSRTNLARRSPKARLQLAWWSEPVENGPSDLCEQPGHEVFESARILQAPDADRLESGVADQLLSQLPRLDVGRVQEAWPNPLFGDLIEEIGEGGIEGLRDWTV